MVDLQRFCVSGYGAREWMSRPIPVGADAVATDGIIFLVAKGAAKDVEPADGSVLKACDLLHSLFSDLSDDGPYQPLSDVQLPEKQVCAACKGQGCRHSKPQKCEACDGRGDFYYCGHDYDCKSCDGTGDETPADCQRSNRSGGWYTEANRYIKIGRTWYQSKYIELLKTLPGAEIQENPNPMKARFRFDGGYGVIAPCRDPI